MIIPQLKGQLGNQMFQVATAFALAKQLGDEMGLCPELAPGPIHPIFSTFNTCSLPRSTFRYSEPTFRYTPFDMPWHQPHSSYTILDGYFQSIKYFQNELAEFKSYLYIDNAVKKKLRTCIMPIKSTKSTINENANKFVVLHSRRGDYRNYPTIHPICRSEYFQQAVSYFPGYTVIVCTDDFNDFHRENAGKFDYIFSNGSQMDDLFLMTMADGNILSNSSFSWWGAVLNENKGTVIAPKVWFGPSGPDFADIYCDNWIRI